MCQEFRPSNIGRLYKINIKNQVKNVHTDYEIVQIISYHYVQKEGRVIDLVPPGSLKIEGSVCVGIIWRSIDFQASQKQSSIA
jgi:hypothetical protein